MKKSLLSLAAVAFTALLVLATVGTGSAFASPADVSAVFHNLAAFDVGNALLAFGVLGSVRQLNAARSRRRRNGRHCSGGSSQRNRQPHR